MKIYDGFLFFNELDLLEIRLNVLNDVVDYFILVEASVTHQGTPKSFIFEENKNRFSKFLDKIIHIKIDNIPNNFINLPQISSTNFK
jgi:beta-1,4-mannosyl-glycoprotein beta-1,4-N-acetylglucosaminyltransferase